MKTLIDESILRCELITLAANHLTEYRLSDNPSLDEMVEEIPWAVMSAMESKSISPDSNHELKDELIEYFVDFFYR